MRNETEFYTRVDQYVQIGRVERSMAFREAFRGLVGSVKGLFNNHNELPTSGPAAKGA